MEYTEFVRAVRAIFIAALLTAVAYFGFAQTVLSSRNGMILASRSARHFSVEELNRHRTTLSIQLDGAVVRGTRDCSGALILQLRQSAATAAIEAIQNVRGVEVIGPNVVIRVVNPFYKAQFDFGHRDIVVPPLSCGLAAMPFDVRDRRDNLLDPEKITGFSYQITLQCDPRIRLARVFHLAVQDGIVDPQVVACPGSVRTGRAIVNYDPVGRDVIGNPEIGALVIRGRTMSCLLDNPKS